jgi:hypothetical protein
MDVVAMMVAMAWLAMRAMAATPTPGMTGPCCSDQDGES